MRTRMLYCIGIEFLMDEWPDGAFGGKRNHWRVEVIRLNMTLFIR